MFERWRSTVRTLTVRAPARTDRPLRVSQQQRDHANRRPELNALRLLPTGRLVQLDTRRSQLNRVRTTQQRRRSSGRELRAGIRTNARSYRPVPTAKEVWWTTPVLSFLANSGFVA
jgi:hypothetical protein